MPSILNLKFKGNKSFVAFSNLGDTESLTKTWKVCTKVASYLEQGQRLENLSWRLWHLQNLMVDTDNAKSKREFKKLSRTMGDKLDKEKGRSIEELEAPDFKRNASSDMIRQRAVEKERSRLASQNAQPGTIKRMQFTFSIDPPMPAAPNVVRKPDTKPSSEFKDTASKRGRPLTRASAQQLDTSNDIVMDTSGNKDTPAQRRRKAHENNPELTPTLRFPTLFSNDFGPSALLYPTPSVTTSMSYGEGVGFNTCSDGFSILRPTIELPLDELLSNVDPSENGYHWPYSQNGDLQPDQESKTSTSSTDILMYPDLNNYREQSESSDEDEDMMLTEVPPISQAVKEALPPLTSKIGPRSGTGANTPTGRPTLTVKTQASPVTRSSGPGATATSLNPAAILRSTNGAPGGVKAECSNCGATHTPLWRRGLNDELNCNACGLYCKLHKRPRPKSMRSNHGESRAQVVPRQEPVDVMAQCYNCRTTATPLWRKDDEGKTVCNACGLYYKLHGSARPISMKSDVIRKRSRHDARRANQDVSETPSVSPEASCRTSPVLERSPTLAPDSTTQPSYEFHVDEPEAQGPTQSELMNALGQESASNAGNYSQGHFSNGNHVFNSFPGPYHPDYLQNLQNFCTQSDAFPFSSVDTLETENSGCEKRSNKRRRMSNDSASEPPSSAVSYSSYQDSFSGHSSAASHSRRSSMDFPFFASYNILRGSSNTFWHPPMLPQDRSPQVIHPPMLPPEDMPMDFLHPPMLPHEEENLFTTYLHPPMLLPDESTAASANQQQPHPPMLPHGFHDNNNNRNSQAFYDTDMQTY